MEISKAVALRLGKMLNSNNMTQYRFAQISGIPFDMIKSIMKGRAKGVNLKTVILIAEAFNISASEFLNDPIFKADNLKLDW